MRNESDTDRADGANVAVTALKLIAAVVFIGGMTFALVVGYAHLDDGSETPRFEQVEGEEFRFEVVGDWENPGPYDGYDRAEIESIVAEYTNEERAAEGLEELEYRDEFVDVSRTHSEDMADNGYVGHVDSQGRSFDDRIEFEDTDAEVCLTTPERDRLEEIGGEITDGRPSVGENAGATFYEVEIEDERTGEEIVNENEDDIARSLVNDWMESPAHRDNILSEEWNTVSVGVYVSEGKTVFATQVFCGLDIDIP